MTNINRPVSEINPTTQTDLVEDNNAIKHEEVVKMDPSIAQGTDPNLHPADTTRPLDPDDKEAEAGDQALATGAGSVGGAAIGATLGMVGGPGGSLIGGVVGGVLGGIAGKDISTPDHPDHGIENSSLLGDHDKYWREEYQSRPYFIVKAAMCMGIWTMIVIIAGLTNSVMKTVNITMVKNLMKLNLICVPNGNRLKVTPVSIGKKPSLQ